MRASFLLGLSFVSIVVAACSSGDPPAPAPDPIGRTSSAIINGSPDTTHQAVVAIISQDQAQKQEGLCSGTIVKVDPKTKIGWVLTAAHCVGLPPVLVVQSNDINDPNGIQYAVLDYQAAPGYQQGGNADQTGDFAVVRILGVDDKTPTIPLATNPDGIGSGTPITAVGYGRTTLINSGSQDMNTLRRNVDLTVDQLNAAQIAYNMSQRGICQGDSGGPDLVQAGGGEKVVGVHSFVSGDCNGEGVSGRVTYGLSFINQQLGKAAPKDDCAFCQKVVNSGEQVCASLTRACLGDKDCKGYYDCMSSCIGLQCQTKCAQQYPKAEGPFAAAAGCACTRGCPTECGGSAECKGVPKCGYKFPAGDCSTCTEGACCQEALDCGADGECYVCLKGGDKDPGCADNAARKKLATCVASKCNTECAGTGLTTGADPSATDPNGDGSSGGQTTTTTTTSGCAVSGAPSRGAGTSAGLGVAVALGLALARRRRAS